jgi:hypothetical protein
MPAERLELSYPDIPETDGLARISMILEFNGSRAMLLVIGFADVKGNSLQLDIVLHQHTVDERGNSCWTLQRPIAIESGSGP